MPTIDIVVPCYQYGRYLRYCVESVLNQDIRDLRVLVIDNASTDNSLEVARELAAEDRRVEVVAHRTNLGRHASYNEGIEWASSDYFIILCADDLLAPGSLSRAVSFMEKQRDVHLTHGRALFISGDDPVPHIQPRADQAKWQVLPGKELLKWLCRGGPVLVSSTVVVRTSVQKRAGFYRHELSNTDDFEMWMRFATLGAVAKTDAVQGIFRKHANSATASVSNKEIGSWIPLLEATFESFFENEGASVPGMMRLRRTARRTLAQHAYWAAVANLLSGGDARTSRALWNFAFSRWPTTIFIPPVSYLFRTDHAFKRINRVVSDAARQVLQASRQRRIS
jgi:glycosyltransferase involved in cell wall biosynthesis